MNLKKNSSKLNLQEIQKIYKHIHDNIYVKLFK